MALATAAFCPTTPNEIKKLKLQCYTQPAIWHMHTVVASWVSFIFISRLVIFFRSLSFCRTCYLLSTHLLTYYQYFYSFQKSTELSAFAYLIGLNIFRLHQSPLRHERLIQLHPPCWLSKWKYVPQQNVCVLQDARFQVAMK